MSLPKRVTVELTNKCNRSCPSCPRHKMTFPQGFMAPELFTKTIAQLPNETVIVPFFRGESLLHPDFASCMKQLSRFKQVQFASNGDKLSEPNQTAILCACSFFSLSLHTYLMPWRFKNSKFLRILTKKGVDTQVSILEKLVPPKWKSTFVQHWSRYVNRVRLYKEHSVNGFGDMEGANKPTEQCEKPFSEMVVYWNGQVGLCNHDWNNLTPLGNLDAQTVSEVWNGPEYADVRQRHAGKLRGSVPSCRDCDAAPKVMYGELYVANSQQQTA